MNNNQELAPVVTIKNNEAITSSRDVAKYFGKTHKNVLRDIEVMVEMEPEAQLNFEPCSYQAVEGGRSYRAVDMSRDGFTLLAMGFTGKKALGFKLKYIEAFNRMEEHLNAQVTGGAVGHANDNRIDALIQIVESLCLTTKQLAEMSKAVCLGRA